MARAGINGLGVLTMHSVTNPELCHTTLKENAIDNDTLDDGDDDDDEGTVLVFDRIFHSRVLLLLEQIDYAIGVLKPAYK
jgi:hypothetical protein